MGLLLRPDAYFAESSDGAYFLTHQGPVVFTGRSVHQLIERLTPYLDGQHTLADLTADLSTERQDAVRKLILMLTDHGVVREVAEPQPASQGAAARPETRYLGYFHDAPVRTFEQYQDTRTLVLGDGPGASAVASIIVRSATRSGLRHVRTASTMDSAAFDEVDLVLHVCAEFDSAELLERHYDGWLGQVVLRGDDAWLGITAPGGANLWGSVRRRLDARHQADPGMPVSGGAAFTAVATRITHGVFRAITGLDEPRTNRVTRIDLSTLDDEAHTVIPHPLARPLAATGPTSPAGPAPDLDPEAFSRQAVACTGDRIGLFGQPTERDLAQIPLHVCEIEVSDPAGLLGANAPAPVVTGAGLDFPTARYRAALRAFACYASLMVDRRRLRGGFVTGYAPGSVDPVAVPANLAFPVLDGAPSPYVPPTGVAAGYGLLAAIETGLVEHCRRLTVAELSTVEPPARWIDLAGAPLDAAGDRYRAMLAAIGAPVTVYDITGSLGVPTFVSYLDGQSAGCASRLAVTDALTAMLEDTILYYQARENGQTGYAPPAAPALAHRRPDDPVGPLPRSVDLATVFTTMTGRGHRPVAVPLDHDPEATKIMTYSVRVVLLDD